MSTLYIITCIVAILTCPIAVSLYGVTSFKNKSIYLSFYVYGKIRIIGGRIEKSGKKLIYRYACDKYIKLNLGGMKFFKPKLSDLKAVAVPNLHLTISLPFCGESFFIGAIFSELSNSLLPYFCCDCNDIKIMTYIGKDEGVKMYYKAIFVFNLLVLLYLSIKSLRGNEK